MLAAAASSCCERGLPTAFSLSACERQRRLCSVSSRSTPTIELTVSDTLRSSRRQGTLAPYDRFPGTAAVARRRQGAIGKTVGRTSAHSDELTDPTLNRHPFHRVSRRQAAVRSMRRENCATRPALLRRAYCSEVPSWVAALCIASTYRRQSSSRSRTMNSSACRSSRFILAWT